jgi:predicted dehydrogenase
MKNADTPQSIDRRNFLAKVTTGVLAATVIGTASATGAEPPLVSEEEPDVPVKPVPRKQLNDKDEVQEGPYPTPDPPAKRVGYCIVGLGNLTLGELLPALGNCKYSRITALVSGDRNKALNVAAQYGVPEKNIYSYTDFDKIKDNKDIDVVYIVLPNSMHHEYTIRAARAGKHVLCEKPMANTSQQCREMIDACKNAGRKLMVAYRIQYEPNNTMVKKWVREQTYGPVRLIESHNGQEIGDPTQWRLKKELSGGGALPDIGIYCINTIRFLLGTEPVSVFASMYSTPGDERFKEVEETVQFQLEFPGGIFANCVTTYGAHHARRYRLYTNKGAHFGMEPAFDYRGLQIHLHRVVDGKFEQHEKPALPEKNQFALEMDHFSWCVSNDKEAYTKGEEGLQDMLIIEAIYRSAREGKRIQIEPVKGTDPFRGTPPKDEQ